jgi:hypothetical protein
MLRSPWSRFGLAVLAILAGPRSVLASVVTGMDTEALVRLSTVIVSGEVVAVSVSPDDRGTIHTWVTIRVGESLKGADGRSEIVLGLPGGVWRDRVSRVYGTPRFAVGERVVVFATPTKGGVLTVTGLFQGKLRVEAKGDGTEDVVPDAGAGTRVAGSGGAPRRESLPAFLTRVRALVRLHPASGTSNDLRSEAPASSRPEVTPSFTLLNPIVPLRWFEPDNGRTVTFRFNPTSSPVSASAARAGFVNAMEAWTDVAGASIVVGDGGDTTQVCRVFSDGSVISHGDPCNQMPAFDAVNCAGVLAITGVSGFTLQSKVVNGVSFLRLTEADTVFNADTECFYAGNEAKNYEEVLTHEMGHALGLGHSCGDAFSPACVPGTEADDALMRAFAHGEGRGGTPQADDRDGLRFIYPTEGFVDLILDRSAYTTGQTANLKADFTGTAAVDIYLLEVLPDGTFVSIAPGFPVNRAVPAATNVRLGFFLDVPLSSHTFSGSELAGTYHWIAVLTRTGTNVANTANWVGFDYASFTFTP